MLQAARRNTSNFIRDEAAYDAAIQRHIRANARKGREDRWYAADPTRADLIQRLCREANGGFLGKMLDSFQEWGSLTDGQERAIRASFEKRDGKKAEARARDAGSVHVGEVGKRMDLTLTVRSIIEIEGDFYSFTLTIFADAAGNVLVYKGKSLGFFEDERTYCHVAGGDTVTLKATVKEHGEREGVKQTIINRPKLVSAIRARAQ